MQKNYAINRSKSYTKRSLFYDKGILLLLCVLPMFQSIFAREDQKEPAGFTVQNNNANNSYSYSSSNNNAETNKTIVPNTQQPSVPSIVTQQSPALYATKKEIVALLIGAGYVSIIALLYGVAYTCDHYCPWAHWKQELPVRQLRKKTQPELAAELFEALNTQYENEHRQGDFLTPLVCFINAVDGEMAWHRTFLSMHAWLDYLIIFPKQRLTHMRITEQYERLKMIRHILVTWLTAYTNGETKTCFSVP